ncbi:M10 family metallopeptidase C-terminal domain-containing protein [Vreelandella massiliensis]|uniref:M10 family metallopeptidase C-terminal domain-containing protein n=1 Tax=Vreelandella massiliensis TaxID=1816686 RepID=UPI00096A5CE2|nr:M10 family metallopeptidase C-terminal domain-containing protein [Halomonas massiliensis]
MTREEALAQNANAIALFNALVSGNDDTEALVDEAYANLLGLEGDFSNAAERKAFWINQFESGDVTEENFAEEFLFLAQNEPGDLTEEEQAFNTGAVPTVAEASNGVAAQLEAEGRSIQDLTGEEVAEFAQSIRESASAAGQAAAEAAREEAGQGDEEGNGQEEDGQEDGEQGETDDTPANENPLAGSEGGSTYVLSSALSNIDNLPDEFELDTSKRYTPDDVLTPPSYAHLVPALEDIASRATNIDSADELLAITDYVFRPTSAAEFVNIAGTGPSPKAPLPYERSVLENAQSVEIVDSVENGASDIFNGNVDFSGINVTKFDFSGADFTNAYGLENSSSIIDLMNLTVGEDGADILLPSGVANLYAPSGEVDVFGGAGEDFVYVADGASKHFVGGEGADFYYTSGPNSTPGEQHSLFAGAETEQDANGVFAEGADSIAESNAAFGTLMGTGLNKTGVFDNANVLKGGQGDDIMVASSTKDVFLYQPGSGQGSDSIHNFHIGEDVIASSQRLNNADKSQFKDLFATAANAGTATVEAVDAANGHRIDVSAEDLGWSLININADANTAELVFNAPEWTALNTVLGQDAPNGFENLTAAQDFTIQLVGVQGLTDSTTVNEFFAADPDTAA